MPGDFTFPHSLNDQVYYPDVPADGAAARQQFMDLLDAIKDNMNNNLAQQMDLAAKANQADLNAHLAENAKHVPHLGTTTNAGNVYSVTSAEVIDDNDKFSVKFNATATGTATLNISSDGTPRTLKKPDGNDFKPKAGIYSFIRDGVNFQLLGEGGEYGTALQGDVRNTKTIGTENGVVQGTLDLSNMIASNIKKSINIGGVVGSLDFLTDSTAGGNIILASVSEISTVERSYVKLKEIKVNVNGTVRVKFSMRISSDGYSAKGKVYKNGVAVGIERSNTTTTYVTFSEDFTVANGDLLQLYGYASNFTGYIKDFFVCVTENSPVGQVTLGGN